MKLRSFLFLALVAGSVGFANAQMIYQDDFTTGANRSALSPLHNTAVPFGSGSGTPWTVETVFGTGNLLFGNGANAGRVQPTAGHHSEVAFLPFTPNGTSCYKVSLDMHLPATGGPVNTAAVGFFNNSGGWVWTGRTLLNTRAEGLELQLGGTPPGDVLQKFAWTGFDEYLPRNYGLIYDSENQEAYLTINDQIWIGPTDVSYFQPGDVTRVGFYRDNDCNTQSWFDNFKFEEVDVPRTYKGTIDIPNFAGPDAWASSYEAQIKDDNGNWLGGLGGGLVGFDWTFRFMGDWMTPGEQYWLYFRSDTSLYNRIAFTLLPSGMTTIGTITLTIGDVDRDGEIGAADFDAVVSRFGDSTSDPVDVDRDGEVGSSDFDIVVQNYGAEGFIP